MIIKSQSAISTYFDNSTNGFASSNVQQALEEVEPFSFSFVNKDIKVAFNKQMSVYQEIEIDSGFEVDLEGEIVLYE